MFGPKKKIRNGEALISQGMGILTRAIETIQKGVEENASEIADNKVQVEKLATRNDTLEAANAESTTVVANFRKNILGEG